MEPNIPALSPLAEAQRLALEFMGQKSLTDDAPADIAREYCMVRQQIYQTLDAASRAQP